MKTDLEKAFIGTCENCKKENVKVRRVQSVGSILGGGSRGYFNICFVCLKPVIYIKVRGRTVESPMNDYKPEKVTK